MTCTGFAHTCSAGAASPSAATSDCGRAPAAWPRRRPPSPRKRVRAPSLIREVGTESRALALAGATLAELGEFAGADLDAEFSVGPDTPALGGTDEPLELDAGELDELFSWFDLGWRVLDQVMADQRRTGASSRPCSCGPSTSTSAPRSTSVTG